MREPVKGLRRWSPEEVQVSRHEDDDVKHLRDERHSCQLLSVSTCLISEIFDRLYLSTSEKEKKKKSSLDRSTAAGVRTFGALVAKERP